MTRGALLLSVSLGAIAVAAGCGGKSIVIGGDESGAAGELVTGGAYSTGGAYTGGAGGAPMTPGAIPTGGTYPTGGAGPSGGTDFVTGGAFPTGGTDGLHPNGGTDSGVNGGSSATPAGGTNGVGGVVDAYPIVFWENGDGYRRSCPRWGDFWGFTCWSAPQDAPVAACSLDGEPYCNACSCAVPCETSEDCPAALTGQRAACLASPTNVPSCFVLCEPRTHCPTGMQCSIHPGTGVSVCVWVSDRVE